MQPAEPVCSTPSHQQRSVAVCDSGPAAAAAAASAYSAQHCCPPLTLKATLEASTKPLPTHTLGWPSSTAPAAASSVPGRSPSAMYSCGTMRDSCWARCASVTDLCLDPSAASCVPNSAPVRGVFLQVAGEAKQLSCTPGRSQHTQCCAERQEQGNLHSAADVCRQQPACHDSLRLQLTSPSLPAQPVSGTPRPRQPSLLNTATGHAQA